MALAFDVVKDSGIPLYIQMEEQIRLWVHKGELKPGDPMPTVRQLAIEVGINYNTVARVYRDLQQAGVLVLKRGIGTFVAQTPQTVAVDGHSLRSIEKKAVELIQLSHQHGMRPVELYQMLEAQYKKLTSSKNTPTKD